MRTVKLLSWHGQVVAKARSLARKGVMVDATPLMRTSSAVTELAALNPAALVLDMDRLPSNCREIALMLRASKSARHIAILFAGTLPPEGAGGLPEKYARLKAELPDIPYAAWPKAARALEELLLGPPTAPPVVPPARVYTASLARKLGVLSASAKPAKTARKIVRQIALLGAPDGFVDLLGELPGSVQLVRKIGPGLQLALCFVRSLGETAALLDVLTCQLPEGASAWIVYPKKGQGRIGEFTENDVRNLGLAAGWVDYKICSIDATWSGMKFARRRNGKA